MIKQHVNLVKSSCYKLTQIKRALTYYSNCCSTSTKYFKVRLLLSERTVRFDICKSTSSRCMRALQIYRLSEITHQCMTNKR